MPLTYVTEQDFVVEYLARGPVDGTPDGTFASAVPIRTRCNSFRYRRFVTKRLDGGGFGPYPLARPGKLDAELDLEVDVAYSGRLTAVVGHYANVRFRLPSFPANVWEETGDLVITEHEFSISQNEKVMQRVRMEGYADQ